MCDVRLNTFSLIFYPTSHISLLTSELSLLALWSLPSGLIGVYRRLVLKRSLAGENHGRPCLVAGLDHLEVSH